MLVMRVAEPYNPHTHIGFNKLSLWLVEEYEKIAFFAPTVWFRRVRCPRFSCPSHPFHCLPCPGQKRQAI